MKNILIALSIFICSCAVQTTEIKTQQIEEPPAKPDYSSGSLWQSGSTGYVEDFKARRPGDILTIVISETSSASKEAKTGTKRSTDISGGVPNFMGLEAHKRLTDLIAGKQGEMIKANVASTYDGAGSTSRKENLNATITAKIVSVLSNGNFAIEGRRNVKVNNEDQEIVLEGVVRPRDISSDNVINSMYIADAKITYTGKGIISDRQSPGWLMNIIDKIWPF